MPSSIASTNIEIYKQLALSQAQRALSLGDLEHNSQTFGCFDRYYWHYRQIDFANARFQEAVLFLALLYQIDEESNPFYQKSSIYKIIQAGINFWATIQNKDGSFNEYRPYDRSYSATANSSLAIALSCSNLNLNAPKQSLKLACQWLIKNWRITKIEEIAKALHVCLLCSNEFNINLEVNKAIAILRKKLITFEEQDWDMGSLSDLLSSLASINNFLEEESFNETINLIVDALSHHIQPEGKIIDTKDSRSANILFPYGLVLLNKFPLLDYHISALTSNHIIRPAWLDDRTFIPLCNNYLQSHFYINNTN